MAAPRSPPRVVALLMMLVAVAAGLLGGDAADVLLNQYPILMTHDAATGYLTSVLLGSDDGVCFHGRKYFDRLIILCFPPSLLRPPLDQIL